jgi:hypothetical protein
VHLIETLHEGSELGHGVDDRDLGCPVEDHSERSLLRVLPDEDDRPPEIRVDERRPGDQEVPFQ